MSVQHLELSILQVKSKALIYSKMEKYNEHPKIPASFTIIGKEEHILMKDTGIHSRIGRHT